MLVLPSTTPDGWELETGLEDPQSRQYTLSYREQSGGCDQSTPPLGTVSYCEMLLQEEEKKRASWVGPPTLYHLRVVTIIVIRPRG